MREAVPAKLRFNGAGQLIGRPGITYNHPWPCANGSPGGGSPSMMGVVLHTEDGFEQGTIEWFNNPAAQASAFFAVGEDGAIHQFGPVGKNWMAWAQEDGNPMWYSIEDADNGNVAPRHAIPFTWEQVKSIAQITEALSEYEGFPLQVTDSVDVKGVGVHSMGGVPWGDHLECPGPVRAAQRPHILAIAELIRDPAGTVVLVKPKRKPVRKAVKKAAHGTRKVVQKEPVVSAAGASGALSAAVALLAGKLGWHLTHAQLSAILVALPALATLFAAWRARPVRLPVMTGALATIATACLAFGLHWPASYVGTNAAFASAVIALLLRIHVTPAAPAAATPAMQATLQATLAQATHQAAALTP